MTSTSPTTARHFTPLLTGTSQTSTTFTGQDGHAYGFYVVATDNVGNVEPTPTAAQAVTTVDATPPTSSVDPLPSTEASPSFPVTWSGQDNPGGSGLASYSIYVSTDGGPFQPLLLGTTATSTTFTGARGHAYGFYSVATDNVSNMEPTPSAAQASTEVLGSSTTTAATDASVSFSESDQPVMLSATVTSSGRHRRTRAPTPSRSSAGGSPIGSPVTVPVTSGAANATYTLPAGTPAGTYGIQAVFNGTPDFGGSSDTGHSLNVSPATTTTSAANASVPFSTADQAVPLSATISSPAGTVGEGTETFTILSGGSAPSGRRSPFPSPPAPRMPATRCPPELPPEPTPSRPSSTAHRTSAAPPTPDTR